MHDKKYQAEEASSSSTSGKYKMREQLGQFLWESVFAISSLTSLAIKPCYSRCSFYLQWHRLGLKFHCPGSAQKNV